MVRDVFQAFAENFAGMVKTSGQGLKGIFDWGK
jgi:hypothetical protein